MSPHLPAFLFCLAGFGALALAGDRQQDELFGHGLGRRITLQLRCAGWGLLLVALAVLVLMQGWALGLVSYSGHTSAAAGAVFLALVAHQRWETRQRDGRKKPHV